MRAPYSAVAVLAAAAVCQAQEIDISPTFQSQSRLVLLPFRVIRGKNYVTDLKQSAVTLLEDGIAREFTIFDTPASKGRLPIELVLLFDVNPAIDYMWDPADVFRFRPDWNDTLSRAILQADKLRISVYRCSGKMLYRSSAPTTDAGVLTGAFRALLEPPEPATAIALTLPPPRRGVGPGRYTNDYVTVRSIRPNNAAGPWRPRSVCSTRSPPRRIRFLASS